MHQKGIIGVLILSLFLALPAYAKTRQTVDKPITADDIVAKMKIQLGLTDDQAIKVKPIVEDYMAHEKLLRLDEKKQLSKVLTGQQLFTWDFLLNEPQKEKKKL
jgi:hypothetical protein